MNFWLNVFLIIVLTLISGWTDSQGFIHASRTWVHGKLIWNELLLTFLGFGTGFVAYVFAVNYLNQVGIFMPEIQTFIWFSAAIIGVAIASGKFVHWQRVDQIIAFVAILCIGWLLIRYG